MIVPLPDRWPDQPAISPRLLVDELRAALADVAPRAEIVAAVVAGASVLRLEVATRTHPEARRVADVVRAFAERYPDVLIALATRVERNGRSH